MSDDFGAQVGGYRSLGNHVHLAAEEILEILLHRHNVEETAAIDRYLVAPRHGRANRTL